MREAQITAEQKRSDSRAKSLLLANLECILHVGKPEGEFWLASFGGGAPYDGINYWQMMP